MLERFALLCCVVAALAGCTTAPGGRGGQDTIIHVTQVSSRQWLAEYTLQSAVTQVVFARPITQFRAGVWRPDPGFAIRNQDGLEVLQRRDHKPFDAFAVRVPAVFEQWPKDYPQNYLFTDGSVLLYTGHFVIDTDDGRYNLVLQPAADHLLVVRGQRYREATMIIDPGDDGLFAYFGTIEPVMTEHFIGIIDPGLPRWLAELAARQLPPLFEYYAQRFDRRLAQRPTVYFSFEPAAGDAYHFKGGALADGTFNLSIVGDAWRDATAKMRAVAPMSIAHEAAHLWNLDLAPGSSIGAWVHEGGAEVLSWLALRDLGLISAAKFEEALCGAFDDCALKLGGVPLAAAEARGRYELSYACGAMIAYAAEAELAKQGDSLFGLTNRLAARARLGGPDNEQRYRKALLSATGNAVLDAAILRLTQQPHDDTATALRALLDSADATLQCE